MKLIDVGACFGGRESIQKFTQEMMLSELEKIPFSIAFVHQRTGPVDPGPANDQVLALAAADPRFRPVGSIHPRDTYLWRGEVDRCLAAGVKVFRIDPEASAYPIDAVFIEDIVAKLADSGAVLMAAATLAGLPSRLAAAAAKVNLPVIFTDARYFPLSELIPVAQYYPNVYIETGRITSPAGIELAVKDLGSDRLLFGSGSSRYPAWVSWQVLDRADISEEDREQIAWKTAAELIDLTPVDLPNPGPRGHSCRPTIDVHMHDKFPGGPLPPFPPATYEAEMEHLNLVHGVSSSVHGIYVDIAYGNDEQAAMIDAVERLRGYVVVDPRYYDDSVRELRRLETDSRFVGVKIHDAHANTLTGAPEMVRLMQAIAEYGKPVKIHPLGTNWPERLVEIAQEHPHLPIIAAHGGYGDAPHPTHDAASRLKAASNIFTEFSSTYLAVGAIRRGIEELGYERILFGTDYPLISARYMAAAYEDAELTEIEADAIMYRNALRLFPVFAPSFVPA